MRSILITGGTGSFGRAFVRYLLSDPVIGKDCWGDVSRKYERIVVLSRSEHAQADMAQEFNHDDRLRFFIGDVRDDRRLRRAFEGVDIIVHAAALKRIEVGHYNPTEMVRTNVLGTMNVVEAALDAKVKRVVGISSDKAWQPISAYGQSKALAETVLLSANNTTPKNGPTFAVVRYGNVSGSAGSIIPKWRKLLKENPNHKLNVTDPDCTRFWMFMEEAVRLVHTTIEYPTKPDIHIPTWLPAYRVGDLAYAMGAGCLNITGLPAWEKKHEGMRDGLTSDIARRMSVEEIKKSLEYVQ